MKRRFVYGSRQNIPDYYIEGANKFRIVSDQLGTPRVVFNMTTGAVIAKFNHDEFGVIKANTNVNLKLPFGFAGGLMDWDTGLVRFGARDYDPSLGRWLSKDPILFEGGDTNLYGYVMNDPVNWIDPTGNVAKGFGGCVALATIGGAISGVLWFPVHPLIGGIRGAGMGAIGGMIGCSIPSDAKPPPPRCEPPPSSPPPFNLSK